MGAVLYIFFLKYPSLQPGNAAMLEPGKDHKASYSRVIQDTQWNLNARFWGLMGLESLKS